MLAALARGARARDEPGLDVLAHSLQCATILQHEHPDDFELIAAGLVHDIADAVYPDHADHEQRGAALVEPLLGARTARLVGSHVLAKRYLVSTDATYRARLSDRSALTLQVQGDALDELGRARLERDRDFDAILALRRADERAKVPDAVVADPETWRPVLEQVLVSGT